MFFLVKVAERKVWKDNFGAKIQMSHFNFHGKNELFGSQNIWILAPKMAYLGKMKVVKCIKIRVKWIKMRIKWG